ncbi:hypothetical protein AALB39_02085 [Lachnospiraceae bacterium 54-53]
MSDFNSTKYKNDFAKEAYDRASINFPKGQKAVIEAHWKAKGYKSLNSYINDLIQADMNRKTEDGKTVNHVANNNGIVMGNNSGTIRFK